MSDRPCNLCELKRMRERSKRDGAVLIEKKEKNGWHSVYTRRDGKKILMASFMEISKNCVC